MNPGFTGFSIGRALKAIPSNPLPLKDRGILLFWSMVWVYCLRLFTLPSYFSKYFSLRNWFLIPIGNFHSSSFSLWSLLFTLSFLAGELVPVLVNFSIYFASISFVICCYSYTILSFVFFSWWLSLTRVSWILLEIRSSSALPSTDLSFDTDLECKDVLAGMFLFPW